MNQQHDQSTNGWGLLANGASSRWTIDVDEALDRDEWELEIKGPQVCLLFQLDNLSIPREALRFLQSELELHRTHQPRTAFSGEDTLILGHFGDASVSIVRDNEDFPRCFL